MTAVIPLDAAATPAMETISKPLNVLPKLSRFMSVANHHPDDEYDLIQGHWLDWPRTAELHSNQIFLQDEPEV